ncbi:hypothetical protein DRP43_02900 [candidate division TA06 bacterium]|uniref:Secretion system C-terminal sorting domain-containing protein n=1 Tax=candidate division TA06 bacterium TaxID=2250710 RepID=A0A660SM12_UNCT6|nr:MAG: hypothetical protein DRP43_02900 [candidate division TA06 bacterium]
MNEDFSREEVDSMVSLIGIPLLRMGGITAECLDTLIALNRIYHDVNHPSALILPVRNLAGVEESIEYPDNSRQNVKLGAFSNPFSTVTNITYSISQASEIELSIYNICGQKVTTLNKGFRLRGKYEVKWDAVNFSSGVYYCQLRAGDNLSQTKRLILLSQTR